MASYDSGSNGFIGVPIYRRIRVAVDGCHQSAFHFFFRVFACSRISGRQRADRLYQFFSDVAEDEDAGANGQAPGNDFLSEGRLIGTSPSVGPSEAAKAIPLVTRLSRVRVQPAPSSRKSLEYVLFSAWFLAVFLHQRHRRGGTNLSSAFRGVAAAAADRHPRAIRSSARAKPPAVWAG